jgi:pimeloyl-ACP methyl ester carboxylesterase
VVSSGRVGREPEVSRPRRVGRILVLGLAVVVLVGLLGGLVQLVMERTDAAANPPPGEFVELPDGRMLHVQVAGDTDERPTVLLESGAGASSLGWAWIQPAVAEHATVISYDRSGLGWSQGDPHGADAAAVVEDLRQAATALGHGGPYVLVGHSLGAHYVRAFAAEHPDEVAGVVLVDPSHEESTAATGSSPADAAPVYTALRIATRLGLTRLYDPTAAVLDPLPEPHRSQALAQQHSRAGIDAATTEYLAVDRVGEQLPGGQALGDIPLHVLIATGGATDDASRAMIDTLADLRAELATLSSRGATTVLADADHVSMVTDPQHASAVSDAILDVLAQTDETES